MTERRRTLRTLASGQRVWLAFPHERWAGLQDVSPEGVRITSPLAVGTHLVLRRERGDDVGEARIALVVHSDGHRAGLRFVRHWRAESPGQLDRRTALRIPAHGLTAWVHGPVSSPGVVRDVSSTGARLEPLLPLQVDQCVRIEILFGDALICERHAQVVRVQGDEVGLRFVDFETEAA